ncbi:MAG: hypothetical protein JXA09_16200 [Anaerolineae bacterium]|nr:hypothetical protein [Anaerolineae bacterium]
MVIDSITLKQIVCEAVTTRVDELSCGECFEQVDQYAELVVLGERAAEAMPDVHDHLAHCAECREEVAALIALLRVVYTGPPAKA